MPQKVTVVIIIYSLTLRDGLTAHNPENVYENYQHALGCAFNLIHVLQFWRLLSKSLFSF